MKKCPVFKVVAGSILFAATLMNIFGTFGTISFDHLDHLMQVHYEKESYHQSENLSKPWYHDDVRFCQANNFVALPEETGGIRKNPNNTRRFSIRNQDFLPHHSRTCESVEELLSAISLGIRYWDEQVEKENMSLLEKENYPSTFFPHRCDIPLYSPHQMCSVLNKFSHIVIQGDSLSRHLQGGLLMSLRNDLVGGSIVSSQPNLMYKCKCDSQFSEHIDCRLNDGLYNRFRPHQLGLCSALDPDVQFESVFNINRIHKGVYNFQGVNCSSPESRGVLVIVQGGVHVNFKATRIYYYLIKPFWHDPIFRDCAQRGKAMFIFTSYTAQSGTYDEPYPLQSVENGLKFNRELKELIKPANVTIVDWFNFTLGAMHTDGLHYAAQVNYFKAQHMIALVDLMLKEKRFFHLPW